MIFIICGTILLILGTIGIILPVMPTVPFYIGAAICFGKGSKKIDDWFKTTWMYHQYVKDFKDGMTMGRKHLMFLGMFVLLAGSFYFLRDYIWGQVSAVLILLGYFYFIYFVIKTRKEVVKDDKEEAD